MLREALGHHLDHDPRFRWRGDSVTRIENLSDIAFAIALGMIITGIDAPRTFDDLLKFLVFAIPAAACFAVLLGVWTSHYTFFRRYGVADMKIITLNALLIFLVLYMAYPLRFTFDSLFAWIIASSTGETSRFMEIGVMSFETSGRVVAIFATIYACIFAVIALMYRHAVRHSTQLALNAYELALTRQEALGNALKGLLSLSVALIAYLTPLNGFTGILLCLIGPMHWIAEKRHPAPADDAAAPDP